MRVLCSYFPLLYFITVAQHSIIFQVTNKLPTMLKMSWDFSKFSIGSISWTFAVGDPGHLLGSPMPYINSRSTFARPSHNTELPKTRKSISKPHHKFLSIPIPRNLIVPRFPSL